MFEDILGPVAPKKNTCKDIDLPATPLSMQKDAKEEDPEDPKKPEKNDGCRGTCSPDCDCDKPEDDQVCIDCGNVLDDCDCYGGEDDIGESDVWDADDEVCDCDDYDCNGCNGC